MLRLWPDPDDTPLDDDALLALYAPVDRALPYLRVNFVSSADGAVTLAGYSEGLSSDPDKRVFELLRWLCDAVMVAAGTLRHEGYGAMVLDEDARQWRVANGLAEHPPLVVVSGRLELDPDSPMFTDAPTRPIVLTHDASPEDRREALSEHADVLVHGHGVLDLAAAREELAERGLTQLLCEGGPYLLGSLAAADLLDELCLTISPVLAGPGAGRIIDGGVTAPHELALAHVLLAGGNLITRYIRK